MAYLFIFVSDFVELITFYRHASFKHPMTIVEMMNFFIEIRKNCSKLTSFVTIVLITYFCTRVHVLISGFDESSER